MDLELVIRDDGTGADLVLQNGDLVLGRALRGSVLGSLFCDARRVDPLPVPAGARDSDPRGYWAEERGDRFGSRLWTHEAGKFVPGFLARVEQDVRDALQWALDLGLVRALDVAASRVGVDKVQVDVTLERALPSRFQALWDGEESVELGPLVLRLLTR